MQSTAAIGLQRLELPSGRVQSYNPGVVKLRSSDRWGRIRFIHWVVDSISDENGAFLHHAIGLQLRSGFHANLTYDGGVRHEYTSAAGDLSLIPAYLPFRSQTSGVHEALVVTIDPRLFTERTLGRESMGVELRPQHGIKDMLIAHAISALHAHVLDGDTDNSIVAESVGIALAARLAARYGGFSVPGVAGGLSLRQFQMVKEYIQANIEQPISVGEMADLLQVDEYAFMRAFKRAARVTPHQFVIRARVDLARQLLAETAEPLAQIAFRCGFCSQSHFGSAFRRSFGLSPKAFRKLNT